MPQTTKIGLELFNNLLEKNEIPPILESIEYFGNSIQNPTPYNDKSGIQNFYSLRLVPEYLSLQVNQEMEIVSYVTKHFNWGYSIHLKDVTSIDSYLQGQFKSKYRSIIRRYVNRLEYCFPITYKLFYGDIDFTIYNSIMDNLYQMIISRFGQRQEIHKDVYRWQTLVKETYTKIINGKASLFVIYNGEEPIQVSLNYHFHKILFSAVSSYDIDYSKFGLGHIEIYKQLEWCIANNHDIYEMGVGGMDYKRRWSNNIYQYEHHILYPKKVGVAKILANIEIAKTKIKEYLKSKKANTLVEKFKSRFSKKEFGNDNNPLDVQITKESVSFFANEFELIDWSDLKFSFLRKFLYDFLYSNTQNIRDVKVFQSQKDSNSFIFKGASNVQHLLFENKKGA